MTIAEILALSSQERRAIYGVTGNRTDIDGNTIDMSAVWIKTSAYEGDVENNFVETDKFTNYSTYSFVWHRSDKEKMERSDSGGLPQIRNMPFFITGELSIDFDMISIDDYRRIMKMLYDINCFKVKCYDVVYDRMVITEMYFAPDELPKIYALAEQLHGFGNGNDDWTSIIGVQNHKISMVGTGNDDIRGRYSFK